MSVARASHLSAPIVLGLATYSDGAVEVVLFLIFALVLLAMIRNASLHIPRKRDRKKADGGRIR